MNKHLTALLAVAFACLSSAANAADNQLAEQEKKDGWILLFNGKDYTGWKCNNDKEIASTVVDGSMQPYKSGGYLIVYKKQFGDFILKCDVKMPEECNSGIFVRVENPTNAVHTGFEIQVATGTGNSCHDFGAIYDLVPLRKNATKGPNVWNSVEIKCQGPGMWVKLNGELVCEMNADQFDQPGERAIPGDHKYKLNGAKRAVKDFSRTGYLGFQDHNHPVWYKNVKLLPLDKD
ncbi:MAG: 3-keto-disaccharide hydrolase [Thermoguttaceae bacterium]